MQTNAETSVTTRDAAAANLQRLDGTQQPLELALKALGPSSKGWELA